jgi:hypothetical protein
MAVQQSELADFNRFLSERLSAGDSSLSPEEALKLWRSIQHEREQANEGIRRGLEDVRAERGQPLSEYLNEFKVTNNITDGG